MMALDHCLSSDEAQFTSLEHAPAPHLLRKRDSSGLTTLASSIPPVHCAKLQVTSQSPASSQGSAASCQDRIPAASIPLHQLQISQPCGQDDLSNFALMSPHGTSLAPWPFIHTPPTTTLPSYLFNELTPPPSRQAASHNNRFQHELQVCSSIVQVLFLLHIGVNIHKTKVSLICSIYKCVGNAQHCGTMISSPRCVVSFQGAHPDS